MTIVKLASFGEKAMARSKVTVFSAKKKFLDALDVKMQIIASNVLKGSTPLLTELAVFPQFNTVQQIHQTTEQLLEPQDASHVKEDSIQLRTDAILAQTLMKTVSPVKKMESVHHAMRICSLPQKEHPVLKELISVSQIQSTMLSIMMVTSTVLNVTMDTHGLISSAKSAIQLFLVVKYVTSMEHVEDVTKIHSFQMTELNVLISSQTAWPLILETTSREFLPISLSKSGHVQSVPSVTTGMKTNGTARVSVPIGTGKQPTAMSLES